MFDICYIDHVWKYVSFTAYSGISYYTADVTARAALFPFLLFILLVMITISVSMYRK
jgi:hypothetical protein